MSFSAGRRSLVWGSNFGLRLMADVYIVFVKEVNVKENIFVLTGAPGAGKTTLMSRLKERGVVCMGEPAREIISVQRSIGGAGVFEKNAPLFVELILSRAIAQYESVGSGEGVVVFDRGVADVIAYADLCSYEVAHGWVAARQYRANRKVFFAPCWREIYVNDSERKMTYGAAVKMGDNIRRIYASLGYELIDLPLLSVQDRVDFVCDNLALSGVWEGGAN